MAPPTFVPSGFIVLRTPLLPQSALTTWSDGLSAPAAMAGGGDLDAALASDRALLGERLAALVADPDVREAIFVASPSLDEAIGAWLAGRGDPRARGALDPLARYVARMAARSTPFGLFSGCSTGTLGARTQLALPPRASYRRHTRLDVHYLAALCEALERDETLRTRLRFGPSTGLHETRAQIRYAEAHADAKTRARTYALVSVERTSHLDAALARARDPAGATRGALAEAIVAHDAEIALEDAAAFIDSLIDSQIVVSNLAPVVTGPEPIDDLVATLGAHGSEAVGALDAARASLAALDREGLGRPVERYRAIAAQLAPLPVEADIARLFQVDLYKPAAEASLGRAPLREIERAIELLARLTPRRDDVALRAFREAFRERWEGGSVPLLEALDDETGVGFQSGVAASSEPSPLLEGLHFPPDPAPGTAPFGAREERLLRAITTAAARGDREWALDAADVEALASKTPARLPDAFAVFGAIAARSSEAADRGELRVLVTGIGGPSGAKLFGRFCHGDPVLRANVEAHLRAEESLRPNALFAEIVHLPEGRLGNILCRPCLRAYEIPYLGRSGAPQEHHLSPADLLVAIEGDRIVLRSRRLGREIVPRLTSAHNDATAALGVYRFLCTLADQDGDAVGWSWGALRAPFLPRVTWGRLVLSLARWSVPGSELKGASALGAADRYRRVQALREKHRLPRWIGVADADNVLPLDLDNALHVDALATLAKGREAIGLVEMFPADDELVVEGPEGRFAHEIVVPFVRATSAPPVADPPPETPSAPARGAGPRARRFAPGSEWLFAKLYTGTAAADAVLTRVIAPLVEEMRAAGAVDRWFFLRYGDPRWHLRVRLRGDPARLARDVLPALHERVQPWLEDGRVWRLQLDTYERETERYGGEAGIEPSEALFEADSDAVTGIVSRLEGAEGNEARWRLALRGTHLLVTDLGLDLETRARLMRSMRDAYALEHHADAHLEAEIGARFRAERAALETLIAAPVGSEHPLEPGFAILAERTSKLAPIVATLRAREADGTLVAPVASLAWSYVHMHVNRLLRSEQRAQELVLCDLLARLYESEIARARPRATK